MEMIVVNILSLVLLIGSPEAYADTDRDDRQKQPFTLNDDTQTDGSSREYSRSYKQAIKQLENYIRKESQNLDLENETQPKYYQPQPDDVQNEKSKRPFVMSGQSRGYKFGKRQHVENIQPLIENIAKRYSALNDNIDSYPPNGHFERTIIDDSNESIDKEMQPFVTIQKSKRPFTFSFGKRLSNEGLSTKSESPSANQGDVRPENVGKQPYFTNDDFFGNNKEQPTIYADYNIERKRPFVLSNGNYFRSGYKFGKRSFNDVLSTGRDITLARKEMVDTEDRNEGSINLSSRVANLRRVEKRPFVIFGGYDTRKKSGAANPTSYHRIVGSGLRFGKRQHWDDFGTSLDVKENKPLEADFREKSSDFPFESRYMVDKRPFVIGGIYHRHAKRPIYLHNPWKVPRIIGSGFRFGKRQYTNTRERIDGHHLTLKRPFVLNFGKREHVLTDVPVDFKKRFTFRNDYHFDKLRDMYNVPVNKRPLYLESFGKRNDESRVYEHLARHNDYDNMEYNVPGVPNIPLKHNTVKRPFILGSGRGYKFGK